MVFHMPGLLYKIFPEAVLEGKEDPSINPWSVDYSKLTSVLCQAIKELSARISVLEKK